MVVNDNVVVVCLVVVVVVVSRSLNRENRGVVQCEC